jgi:hypothetical protein
MIAAIYARKSTEQNISDEEKSIARQVAHSRAYAGRKGPSPRTTSTPTTGSRAPSSSSGRGFFG